METKFSDLVVGSRFTLNNVEYIKTEDVRVSCCQVINSYLADNSASRHFIQPETVVVVNG